MWAILVGIERYKSESVDTVTGAVKDVERMYELFTKDMGVSGDKIVVLKNEEATRHAIIRAFQTHFIENTRISHGDPIVFYYTGHGVRVQAPLSWPIGWKDIYDQRREIEMILPYDSVRDIREQRRDREITGIPDRTLGSLLRKISAKHGQNITVILDCCASGHGTRAVPAMPKSVHVRSVDASRVGNVTDETDLEIWGDDNLHSGRRGTYLRGAFVDRQDDTHVLLAACGRREEAHGSADGGWFTTALIAALKDASIHPRSYAEILKHIRNTFDSWYTDFQAYNLDQRPAPQNPQCEGINRDRVIFQNTAVDRRSFAVRSIPGRPGHCQIEMGDIYGIKPGTVFELRQSSPFHTHQTIVGAATAVEVSPGNSVARITDGASIYLQGVLAYVTNVGDPLRFAVVNDHPDSKPATDLFNLLTERLLLMTPQTASLCSRVSTETEAELILRVQPNRVLLDRRDLHMSYLTTPHPHVDGIDVARLFPDVMTWFARFNFHMQRDNLLHPFQNEVDIHLHLLQKPTEEVSGHKERDPQECMVPGKEILFKNQEAVVSQDESLIYCLVLHNRSKQALYPYVFLFDPATYCIELFYSPINPHEAPLKPGGELQLGRSEESMTALSFYIQEGQTIDTSFLKLYLASEPMDLSFMEQQPVLGSEARRLPQQTRRRGASAESSPIKGLWDIVTRKMTVDVHFAMD